MGKWCRDKKSSGCAMCKPHKHGYAPKYKERELLYRRRTDNEMRNAKYSLQTELVASALSYKQE